MITSPDRGRYRTGEALNSGFESLDAYRPAEISRLVRKAAVEKAGLELGPLATRALLAGAFIAFGALFYLLVVSGAEPVTGPTRLVGGVAFSLGLVLVIVGGAELFTGNALMVMALVDRQIGFAALLRNWGVVIVGNAVGGISMAILVLMSGLLDGEIGTTARQIAMAKVALGPVEMLARGMLCNALVCLAVWLTFSARTAGGKTTVIILPVAAFVALGFEHCVANFFLLPLGWLSGADISLGGMFRNLAFVTLGNVVGGAGGVALAYRFAYPEEARLAEPLA
jgi:formate/nitrite transporter